MSEQAEMRCVRVEIAVREEVDLYGSFIFVVADGIENEELHDHLLLEFPAMCEKDDFYDECSAGINVDSLQFEQTDDTAAQYRIFRNKNSQLVIEPMK